MPIITERKKSLQIFEQAAEQNVSIAIFCTASYWNTEAILLAAQRIAEKYGVESVPVVIATTFTYSHMPQAKRFLYCRDERSGFLSHMGHMKALCEGKYAPYRNVTVLPHLDHADPIRDSWALTVATPYFSSVMFDAQTYPYEKNLEMTQEYIKTYGKDVLVEGIIEQLQVEDVIASHIDNYCERAIDYVKQTGVDFLVADLGTEQQANTVGKAHYNKSRARNLTAVLDKKMLVLHGTSSLSETEIKGLAEDGVVRVNMWTRIAREAGQYAAHKIENRMAEIDKGVFSSAESYEYIRDNVEKAAEIMESMMELFGYGNWKK